MRGRNFHNEVALADIVSSFVVHNSINIEVFCFSDMSLWPSFCKEAGVLLGSSFENLRYQIIVGIMGAIEVFGMFTI